MRKMIVAAMVMVFAAASLCEGTALAGGNTPALGSPWRYSCNKGGKSGPSQGTVLMEIYIGGGTDKTPMQLVNECNDKYPNGCEGECWACYSYMCYNLDGKCEGTACN